MSGTHGVGKSVAGEHRGAQEQKIVFIPRQGQVSAGLQARYELLEIFASWADWNVKRAQKGEPLLRLMLTTFGGGPSEMPYDEWEILPEEMPRDRRSSSAPMAWNWSLSFWGIDHRSDHPADPNARDFMQVNQREVLEDADEKLEAVETNLTKLLKKIGKAVQSVRNFITLVRTIRETIKGVLAAGKRIAQGLGDMALSLAQAATGFMEDCQVFFRDSRDYVRGFARELRDQAMKARCIAGNLARASHRPWDRSMPEAYPESRAASAPVQPGDTIQGVAQRILGDAGRWVELAELNNLDYPFFDFSGGNGAADPAYAQAGLRVLGSGDVLTLPLVGGMERPADPIGWDRDEGGSLALMVGRDNLSAALLRRLRTPEGWIVYHPEYGAGLHRRVGAPLTVATILELRRDITLALLRDPRVLKVLSVSAVVNADAVIVSAEVETPLGFLQVAGNL